MDMFGASYCSQLNWSALLLGSGSVLRLIRPVHWGLSISGWSSGWRDMVTASIFTVWSQEYMYRDLRKDL